MRISTNLMLAALGAGVLVLGAPSAAWAQAGTTQSAPVVNQATKAQTDAAKKAMEDERRRQEEEAKKKAMQQK
jgi:hypothetical protein